MSSKSTLRQIKSFGMTNQMIVEDLNSIASQHGIDLGVTNSTTPIVEDSYYAQFTAAARQEAAVMSKHYEVFYCLEKTIRVLVSESIQAFDKTEEWWNEKRVPEHVISEVKNRIQKEKDDAVTRRSDSELEYTTFGELSQIIVKNWEIFGGIFDSKKGLEKVMASLGSLRNPIAHCCPLAPDEVVRLNLAVGDWFRQMDAS